MSLTLINTRNNLVNTWHLGCINQGLGSEVVHSMCFRVHRKRVPWDEASSDDQSISSLQSGRQGVHWVLCNILGWKTWSEKFLFQTYTWFQYHSICVMDWHTRIHTCTFLTFSIDRKHMATYHMRKIRQYSRNFDWYIYHITIYIIAIILYKIS